MLSPFIEFLVKQLVEDPHVVKVSCTQISEKLHVVIAVSATDVKRVIGKEGRLAKALQGCVAAFNPQSYIDVSVEAIC